MPLHRHTPAHAWLYLGLGLLLLLSPWGWPFWISRGEVALGFFNEPVFGIKAGWLFGPLWLGQAQVGLAFMVVACRIPAVASR